MSFETIEKTDSNVIKIRGARVHNLKNIDIDISLGKLVAVCGVSGSGKSSLALGVLYAEGSRRYLEALSAYTRRRMTQAVEAKIDSIENVPAALALHQRPAMPDVRSTFGTQTELLNILRLMYSRLGSHKCPNGHTISPTADVARGKQLICPTCGVEFEPPSAEAFSFNSDGACPHCAGTGIVREVDDNKLVPDQTKTLEDGAVESWNMFGISWMYRVAGELGVRIDVPFSELTEEEKRIVYEGEEVKKYIVIPSKNGKMFDLNCTYRNAHKAVEEALHKAETEKGIERIDKYLSVLPCKYCHGTRLNDRARSTLLCGLDLPTATAMTLNELVQWVRDIPFSMPDMLKEVAESITTQFLRSADRLIDLGLGYLTLDRAASTLSTGERQRVQLAKAVKNRTTGVLYVLDEPSIGLHPSNVDGLLEIIKDLIAHGNSVVLVDHDVRILKSADWLIEMGIGAGEHGGSVVAAGSIDAAEKNPDSLIGGFLSGKERTIVRNRTNPDKIFEQGFIQLSTSPLHTVHSINLKIPKGKLTAVTGVSGSGKTTLILESLVPALQANFNHEAMPLHIKSLSANGIECVNTIDATPIGANIRSTVATYSGILDDLRRIYALTPDAKALGKKTGDFSYNTGSLRCPTCDGTGQITMDVQFLPDVEIVCPDCGGLRYRKEARAIRRISKSGKDEISLPELMSLTIEQAIKKLSDVKKVREKLQMLSDMGLGYLTLGEATPSLSGGEAQRLKLVSEMGKSQESTLFVFDEPTIGLHPLDVRVLIGVFQILIENGATIVVIEHDIDMIANADYVIDMGPGGGIDGGRIVAEGTPAEIANNPLSITGKYLKGIV
ncbi:MAG: excinuclease ABC subunit UvrA [Firmicutes bacterium]|nr:excinuclease ABC subunit UvrA [Bacillota bacterium]